VTGGAEKRGAQNEGRGRVLHRVGGKQPRGGNGYIGKGGEHMKLKKGKGGEEFWVKNKMKKNGEFKRGRGRLGKRDKHINQRPSSPVKYLKERNIEHKRSKRKERGLIQIQL